jgi:hypothetical protein
LTWLLSLPVCNLTLFAVPCWYLFIFVPSHDSQNFVMVILMPLPLTVTNHLCLCVMLHASIVKVTSTTADWKLSTTMHWLYDGGKLNSHSVPPFSYL